MCDVSEEKNDSIDLFAITVNATDNVSTVLEILGDEDLCDLASRAYDSTQDLLTSEVLEAVASKFLGLLDSVGVCIWNCWSCHFFTLVNIYLLSMSHANRWGSSCC